jgi:SNF2 family DNA or RNA helicase
MALEIDMIKLFAHQIETIEFYRKNPYCLNASSPGTGKSATIIMLTKELTGKCTIVCPAYLLRNWKNEFLNFSGEEVGIYPNISKRITLISVDVCKKCSTSFHNLDLLAIDESTCINNITSQRTQTIHGYVTQFKPKRLILLSGTPMKNRVTELYSILLLLHREKFKKFFPSHWSFYNRYANRVEKRFGNKKVTTFEGTKNLEELKSQWLHGTYIKYTLADLVDLPEVIFEDVVLNIADTIVTRKLDAGLEEGWRALNLDQAPPVSTAFPTLKKENAILKTPEAIKYLKAELEQDRGPILCFSDHITPCEMIAEELGAVMITGATDVKLRQHIVEQFQEGKIPLLVCTIGSMSTGWTLHRSSLVVFVDKNVVPAINFQAYSRIHRSGQKNKCRVVSLVRAGIDSRISKLLREKEKIIAEMGI